MKKVPKDERIENTCAECGMKIEVPLPLDEDEGFEGEIDWGRARMLKSSTVSVCHTCDSRSSWRRKVGADGE